MDHTKGKPINTSVPSIAIRFHANAEEIEELYQSEEEPPPSTEKPSSEKTKCANLGDPESSPLRSYLPRLGKRSTSIDASLTAQDSSPPSDPWKFFAEIKGKITKSVEDTLTEIKQRNQEGDSLSKKSKASKDKDNSSLSDSEDISESSISKTCGIVSTTEGVEMSSDDETPSLEKDKKPNEAPKPQTSKSVDVGSKHRFKIIRKKKPTKEGSISIKALASLYEINTGIRTGTSDDKSSQENIEEVESGVEALEDVNPQQTSPTSLNNTSDSDIASITSDIKIAHTDEEIVTNLTEQIDNLEVDSEKVINIQHITGAEIRQAHFSDDKTRTYFSPEGFVDLRIQENEVSWFDLIYSYRQLIAFLGILMFYFSLSIPIYFNGFLAGIVFTVAITSIYNKFNQSPTSINHAAENSAFSIPLYNSQTILEIPAAKEYQPYTKFEGWMNEYPDVYDPQTYHISQTQSVYIRLQGNLLRISHTRAKIPKRALWNESKHKHVFTQHRIYNLLGAKVTLLPDGLNKRRHWSKKYPICIILNKEQMDFNYTVDQDNLDNEDDKKLKTSESDINLLRKRKAPLQPQIFSKLTEEEEDFDLESESSRPSSPSPPGGVSPDVSEDIKLGDEEEVDELLKDVFENDEGDEEILSLDEWSTFTPEQKESPTDTCLYIFGRTDREKEDWFRRFATATHKGAYVPPDTISTTSGLSEKLSETLITAVKNEEEYLKYMAKFQKSPRSSLAEETEQAANVLWINALIGRVLFDCTRDANITNRVKDRIQRKLSSIKLPYFIEQLSISELSLGSSPPLIHKASKPVLDQRGLWVDLDITYEGVVVLTLQTKLNLMKLKQPPSAENIIEDNPSAKWQSSDVDDTAESSTDDEPQFIPAGKVLDESGFPVTGLGGTSNTSKKFIKMVDKIAESKFFQAATENRYIKKAMEGVSNTDLSLKVELKGLGGVLVLNIPPPPSDRVWIGFRPSPKLWLSAQPIVGERNISFFRHLTGWIERKLSQEFQKVLVIPNMEDILIPVMSPKLPE